MSKQYFFGKYYKFISTNGFSFALIDSYSCEGKAQQIITSFGSFLINDISQIIVTNTDISFSVLQNDISIFGKITFGELTPLKHNAMGPFKIFSMQCSHDIYSMHHSICGSIIINGQTQNFDNGYGYIEGDKGKSFPEKYVWYNSVGKDYGLTLAIATIPFGIFHFTGLLGFISIGKKEYRLCTYNFAKIKLNSKQKIVIKKGKYVLEIDIPICDGNMLKAPDKGKMSRYIKENIAIPSYFVFKKGNTILLEGFDKISSLEYMY